VFGLWEWLTALTEHGLGNIDCARQYVESAIGWDGMLFARDRSVRALVDYLCEQSNGYGQEWDSARLELLKLLSDLLPNPQVRVQFARKSLGYLQARRAFDAYSSNASISGLAHALRAVLLDRQWLRNRGLWATPVKMSLGLLRGRVAPRVRLREAVRPD
jgi:hypothetical protein